MTRVIINAHCWMEGGILYCRAWDQKTYVVSGASSPYGGYGVGWVE